MKYDENHVLKKINLRGKSAAGREDSGFLKSLDHDEMNGNTNRNE